MWLNSCISRVSFVLLSLYSHSIFADNYEGYESHRPGVGLWYFYPADDSEFTVSLHFGLNPEFALHCDGKHKLYVYEIPNQSFTCLVKNWSGSERSPDSPIPISHEGFDAKAMLEQVRLAQKRGSSETDEATYSVAIKGLHVREPGIFTVSKTRLIHGNWNINNLDSEEYAAASSLAQQNLKLIKRQKGVEYKSVIGYSNAGIRKLGSREKVERYTVKISTEKTTIILMPTLYYSDNDGDLISTVIQRDVDGYHFIGHVAGCLLSVGADIDGDGFPEVIMEECYGFEGTDIRYFKLAPQVRQLIIYSHS